MKSSPLRVRVYQFLTKLLDTGEWNQVEAEFLHGLITPKNTEETQNPVWVRKCKICSISMSEVLVNSHYMIRDEIWIGTGFSKTDVACIQCFEKALGRDVSVNDLTSAPINEILRWSLSKNI